MATKVTVLTNSPLMLKGEVELTDAEGKALPTKPDATYLCRCGGSAKKPFCDGTHKKNEFQG